ncbi:choloylglycine hydrolase family protein [Clostridium botulinum]|uniref:choloylglycine hydrolase n=1 Tax=Clostridium botulinum TaxID=1491 RepID=UPI0007740450|nr:choloylglycine hydrolase [Clostridium botulinum]NFF79925.1 choloylglycine hydrolase family protein [Clostridium botulinum]NFH79722.1 choloylglycine hydrolase family protein [Clostridium botulinum]NFH82433.1 choloylglycine hydrolase family protein [Clostridium botulinum]NFI11306.1 choloylglycine hydrolase family protein [Clostridium botulinum]NFI13627.1 choloylglycine hydrolase family protein [Clostridium botulinum]
MCTALTLQTKQCEVLFGRNLDYVVNFNQSVNLIPRNYKWLNGAIDKNEYVKYAILGMGTVFDKFPYLTDGFNEKGLGCAALYFPGYASYNKNLKGDKINLSPYDIILWILGNFKTVEEVIFAFKYVNIVDTPRLRNIIPNEYHWIVTDRSGKSIVIEKTKEKLSIYQDKFGILTNSPTFDWQTTNLNQYIPLNPRQPSDVCWSGQKLTPFGQGLGALGMPGDNTPPSRFVRIAFTKSFIPIPINEKCGIIEFFNSLNTTFEVNGSLITPEGLNEKSLYTSCMNLQKRIYYYNTYDNNRINAVIMKNEDLNSKQIIKYPYMNSLDINYQN